MNGRYSKTGRVRPVGGGFELTVWYLMRLTGLALFVLVLSHYLILHVLFDPAEQDSSWIAEIRWSSTFWRAYDWLMLTLVLFHAIMGMRVVTSDYLNGRGRAVALSLLYLVGIVLFAMGTIVVFTLANVIPQA